MPASGCSAAMCAPFLAAEGFIRRTRKENQKGQYHGNYRENQKRVEIGKSRGLLFAKILKRL